MRQSAKNDFHLIVTAAVLCMAIVLVLPDARAQGRFGLGAPVVLRPAPVTLQAGQPAQQSPSPIRNFALIDPGPIGLATTTNLFAQLAIGGGYTTVFTFLNTGADTTTGNLILTGDSGTPLNATLASPGVGVQAPNSDVRFFASTTSLTVPPGGIQIITASGANPGDPISVGWARVESEGGSLAGVATFQLAQGTKLSSIVGVLSAGALSAATVPVDDDGTVGRSTGYAVANPGTGDVNIKIVLVNSSGTIVQTISPSKLNPLHAGWHVSGFLREDLNNPNFQFKGSMVLIEQTGKTFSVLALVVNQNLLTTIPVVAGKAPGIN